MVLYNQKVYFQISSPADARVFDLDYFTQQTFGDISLQREIMQLFLNQLADVRRALAAPCTDASWRFLTHTLKGAAAAVGANEIAALAETWEGTAAPADASQRSDVLQRFARATDAFRTATTDFAV